MHPDMSAEPRSAIAAAAASEPNVEHTIQYWHQNAQRHLAERLAITENTNRARNVILFLGDGMSLATAAATRVYIGGESSQLSFERFPHIGLSKTYCVDAQVADSACTATAYLNGVKGNYGTVGINAQVKRFDCDGNDQRPEKQTTSIARWAMDHCKAAGLVTTSRVTHASPSGVFANSADRDWETDAKVRARCGDQAGQTVDIARQLIEGKTGADLRVIMGGGREVFRAEGIKDEELGGANRTDGRDLIAEWSERKRKEGRRAQYVWNKDQMLGLDNSTDYVLGLFESDHCRFQSELTASEELRKSEPTLTEMTAAAIRVLNKQKDGYFLFVESARIDMAHHETRARQAIDETAEFSRAIDMARRLTNESDTLIVVTADHAHVMTYNGYPLRGNDILGLSGRLGSDKLPYTTLSYGNGPGYNVTYRNGERLDLSGLDFKDPWQVYPATVPRISETHGGDDVAVYASGPWSHLFVGTYEQSNIPMAMAFAAKIGPYANLTEKCSGASSITASTIGSVVVGIFAMMFWMS